MSNWKLTYRRKYLRSVKLIAYCTPVIIGAVAIATTRLFRAGDIMLVETAADKFFVNLFRIGVSLGVIGTLLLPTGMLLGIRLIRKEKYHSKQTWFSILVMALGIVACVYFVIGAMKAVFK